MEKWNKFFRRARSSGWRNVYLYIKHSFFARVAARNSFWKTMKYLRKKETINKHNTVQLDGKCTDNELDKAKLI